MTREEMAFELVKAVWVRDGAHDIAAGILVWQAVKQVDELLEALEDEEKDDEGEA